MQVNKTQMNQIPQIKKQPSFGSASTGIKSALKSIAKANEYDGYSMSLPTLMTLLYGFTLIPRYVQAYDEYDKKEILTRDFVSITSILFLEKILSKLFSQLNTKMFGFVLNNKPQKHNTVIEKIINYAKPNSGVHVLTSNELSSKYSNIDQFKGGLSDFVDYIKNNGGNIKKMFSHNNEAKKIAKEILGKDLSEATAEELENALKAEHTKKSEKLDKIYKLFNGKDNSFLKKAKALNSAFTFLSLFFIVPFLMIQLQKFNERKTKERRAANAEKNQGVQNNQTPALAKSAQPQKTQETAKAEPVKEVEKNQQEQNAAKQERIYTFNSFLGGN